MLSNTKEEKIAHPEYGRLVQKMVQKALQMDDPELRQKYAEKIIAIMLLRFPKTKRTNDLYAKMWNKLASLANYQLDIQYPVDIIPIDKVEKPAKLAYPQHRVRFRHYGYLVEQAFEKLAEMPEGEERTHCLSKIESRMRRIAPFAKSNGAFNEKIANDVATYLAHATKH